MSEPIPVPPVPAPKAQRQYAAQDQAEAREVELAEEIITTALNEASVAAAVATKGYDAAELKNGLALVQAVDDAYNTRQVADGAGLQATVVLNDARHAAETEYSGFRTIARKACPGDAAATALGLHGPVAHDLAAFITQAKASYAAAQLEPYTANLTKRKYDPATLKALAGKLGALSGTATVKRTINGTRSQATANRESALAALRSWLGEFKASAKVACASQPGLLAKLGV